MALRFLREDGPPHGAVETVAPGIRRVVCNNPSPFTYRGTNSWIIGEGRVAILDPGPVNPAHLAALLQAVAGETVTHILVSHTHGDHSPGAAPLRQAAGAPTYGFGPHVTPADQGGEGGDHGFVPDVTLPDGAAVTGDGWGLVALHTPGHCANHLCFAMEGNGALFSADLVMGWSTSVVSPPDGDMADYMASLARLQARAGDRLYLPGHGPPIPEPAGFVEGLVAHRLEREAKVLAALRAAAGPVTALELVPAVYGALDPRLVGPASRSLAAHLVKIAAEGAARADGGAWRASQ